MKYVEQNLRDRVVRGLPVALFLGALACLGLGVLLSQRAPARRQHADAQPQSTNTDRSREIDQLKQAVSVLEHQSAALTAAVSSSERGAEPERQAEALPAAPSEIKDTRSDVERQQDEFTALDVRFASEKDGSRESLLAARTMHAELSAAPLSGARITTVECSSSLCRATLEQDAGEKPLDMTALIEATPSVRQESAFNYQQEGAVKRVTIYSAREGHRLSPSDANDTSGSPAR